MMNTPAGKLFYFSAVGEQEPAAGLPLPLKRLTGIAAPQIVVGMPQAYEKQRTYAFPRQTAKRAREKRKV
jgi:hypothetical protein